MHRELAIRVTAKRRKRIPLQSLSSELQRALSDFRRRSKISGCDDLEGLDVVGGSGAGRSALVLGNGPSQELLTRPMLERFSENGGDVFVVNNYWRNPALHKLPRMRLVLSDPVEVKAVFQGEPLARKLLDPLDLDSDAHLLMPRLQKRADAPHLDGRIKAIEFCDYEQRYRNFRRYTNIDPRYPRSYTSLTLYKALALAIWYRYETIFVLGMDNTYVHDVRSDCENRVLLLDRHAHQQDRLLDYSEMYESISDFLADCVIALSDAHQFTSSSIINLDSCSLTDAFRKAREPGEIAALLAGTASAQQRSSGG